MKKLFITLALCLSLFIAVPAIAGTLTATITPSGSPAVDSYTVYCDTVPAGTAYTGTVADGAIPLAVDFDTSVWADGDMKCWATATYISNESSNSPDTLFYYDGTGGQILTGPAPPGGVQLNYVD